MPDTEAAEVQRWAHSLGIERSQLLREALHRHLVRLRGERDAEKWGRAPATEAEQSLAEIADWGPAEDWADWDAAVWFAATPGGGRPVLVLTRDPVADSIRSVVVAALTRTRRELVSELTLNPADDGVPSDCVDQLRQYPHRATLGLAPSRHRAVRASHDSGMSHAWRRAGLPAAGDDAGETSARRRRARRTSPEAGWVILSPGPSHRSNLQG